MLVPAIESDLHIGGHHHHGGHACDQSQQPISDRGAGQRAQHHAQLAQQAYIGVLIRSRRIVECGVRGLTSLLLPSDSAVPHEADGLVARVYAGYEGRVTPCQFPGGGLCAGVLIELSDMAPLVGMYSRTVRR